MLNTISLSLSMLPITLLNNENIWIFIPPSLFILTSCSSTLFYAPTTSSIVENIFISDTISAPLASLSIWISALIFIASSKIPNNNLSPNIFSILTLSLLSMCAMSPLLFLLNVNSLTSQPSETPSSLNSPNPPKNSSMLEKATQYSNSPVTLPKETISNLPQNTPPNTSINNEVPTTIDTLGNLTNIYNLNINPLQNPEKYPLPLSIPPSTPLKANNNVNNNMNCPDNNLIWGQGTLNSSPSTTWGDSLPSNHLTPFNNNNPSPTIDNTGNVTNILEQISSTNNLLNAALNIKTNPPLPLNPHLLEELSSLTSHLKSNSFSFTHPYPLTSWNTSIVLRSTYDQLNIIFIPTPNSPSYFSLNQTCLSSLNFINTNFPNNCWTITGELDSLFTNISFDTLYSPLFNNINDPNFNTLIHKFFISSFSANTQTRSTPTHNDPLSPLLINLLLQDLDNFLNLQIPNIINVSNPSCNPPPARYLRFMNNFIIAVNNNDNAENFMTEITSFLNTINPTLSNSIINITPPSQNTAFLGAYFCPASNSSNLNTKTNKLTIEPPTIDLLNALITQGIGNSTTNGWKPWNVGHLVHLPDREVVSFFSRKWTELWSYYQYFDNLSNIAPIHYLLNYSAALTLSNNRNNKLNSLRSVFRHYGNNLTILDPQGNITASMPPYNSPTHLPPWSNPVDPINYINAINPNPHL